MNKNIAIGVLVLAVVVGGIYLIMREKSVDVTVTDTDNTPTNTYTTPASVNTYTTPAVVYPNPALAPNARTDGASEVSRTTANLGGAVNPNGSNSSYWFEFGKTTSLGSVTAYQGTNNGSSMMPVSVLISGLEPLTKYYFRLNAQNQHGMVNGSILSFMTQGPLSLKPPSITTTNASNINSTTATVNGRVNPNGVETNYWFEYSADSLLSVLIGSGTSIETLGAGNNNVNVNADLSGLNRQTKYFYRLMGKNSYGTIQGSVMSFTTKN